ncbi:MAG: hypothetical protein NT169_14235 [Chloroflexi bacterium]|nr:hypothetical protein [Chloroflexota bacterium]
MNIKNKIVATVLSGLAIAGFVATTALVNPQASSAQTAVATPTAKSAVAGGPQGGDRGGLRGGPQDGVNSHDTYLAQALGITEEALQTARTTAHEAAIQQAVKDGLITQAQADAMLNKTAGQPGVRIDLRGADIDNQALLANALGITVEKLQAAEETAAKAELAQAVTDGRITQEQADMKTAQQALQKYIADKGFYASAVQSAVKDGVITQAQADSILSQNKAGTFGGGMGRGGLDGGAGMKGGRGGARP